MVKDPFVGRQNSGSARALGPRLEAIGWEPGKGFGQIEELSALGALQRQAVLNAIRSAEEGL